MTFPGKLGFHPKDIPLTDGQPLQVGDIRLQACETPGHAMGAAKKPN